MKDSSFTTTDLVLDNVTNFLIGFSKSGGPTYFNGKIDEVSIYNRALSASEIQSHYDSTKPTTTGCNGDIQLADNLCEGLTLYMPMDGNANYASGNGSDGTVNGATLTTDRLGNANSAYQFDGQSNYISIADSPQVDFVQSQDFSVMVWVKPDETQSYTAHSNNGIIEKWMGNSEGYPYVIRYENQTSSNPGKVWVARFDGYLEGYENSPLIFSKTTINDGQFHQLALVKNGTTLQLYIDGVLDGETTDTTQGSTNNNSQVFLGRRGADTDYANYFIRKFTKFCR